MNQLLNFGLIVRQERIKRGISQEKLGDLLGVKKSRVSKIENGQGLTMKSIIKISTLLHLNMDSSTYKINVNVINYIVVSISEFASKFNLNNKEASNYLIRYKGIDFLEQHYESEHLLSMDDCIDDLVLICKRNGGGIQ